MKMELQTRKRRTVIDFGEYLFWFKTPCIIFRVLKYGGQIMSETQNKNDLKQNMESIFTVKFDVKFVVTGLDTK